MKSNQRTVNPQLPIDHVTDVNPKRTSVGWLKLIAGLLMLASVGVAAGVWGYRDIYKPYQWRAEVARSLGWFDREDILDDRAELNSLPEVRRLERLGGILPYRPQSVSFKERSAAAIAALELADHLGSPAARYIYGEHLLAGALTSPENLSAESQFARAHKNLSAKVAQGDPRATLYYGLMLNAGFGIKADPTMSVAVFKRVLSEIDQKDLRFLLSRLLLSGSDFSVPKDDAFFPEFVADALIQKGGVLYEAEVGQICEPKYFPEFVKRCERRLAAASKKNEEKEIRIATAEPGRTPPQTLTPSKPASTPAALDKESQNFTGYLKGSPKAAQDGMSTFTVDNSKGGADAVARLYFNGAKPAVRSMYVRTGHIFKAESLSPGNYVLRYRFVGSEETYEADRLIVLKQVKTETGTQFSNVTVTLFREVGGNLNTKKVSPDQF